jgi:hypothetical protein
MRQRWIWGSAVLAVFLVPIPSAGQQQVRKGKVHVVVVDGFGRDLGEAKVVSFKNTDTDHDLARQFHKNQATGVPFGVYEARVVQVGYATAHVTAQVFQPDVWLVVALQYGEELPVFPAPRLQLSGTIKNLDAGEQPVYVRLMGVYPDFIMQTRVEVSGNSASFTLAGVIPNGKYVLITIGRTRVLNVQLLDVKFPAQAPIVIDLTDWNPRISEPPIRVPAARLPASSSFQPSGLPKIRRRI